MRKLLSVMLTLCLVAGVVTITPTAALATAHSAKLTAGDASSSDNLGWTVAINSADGTTMVAGAPGKDAAYVYVRSGSTWSQQAKLVGGDGIDEYGNNWDKDFGRAVAISEDGNTVLVGRYGIGYDGRFGAVYVFTRTGETWTQQAKLIGNENVVEDFGCAVAISGNTAVVGAWQKESTNRGRAFVFTRDTDGVWSLQQTLDGTESHNNRGFGWAVALSGDRALIGTVYSSRAYVFVRSGTTWTEQAILRPPTGTTTNNTFGNAVALNADASVAVVGAPEYYTSDFSYQSGVAFVFTRSGETWAQDTMLTASPYSTDQRVFFGSSAATSADGSKVLIGASGTTSGGKSAQGAAYTFTKSGSTWGSATQITPSDGFANDSFGYSVAMTGDGNANVVGSPRHGSGSSDYGAVYVYGTPPTTYTVTVTVSGGNGTASASPSTVTAGGSSTVELSPNAGYRVGTMTDNGVDVTSSVSSNTYTISSISGNHIVVVTFVAESVTTHTITTTVYVTNYATDPYASDLLHTTGGGPYAQGANASMGAYADDPWIYEFVNWTEGTTVVSTDPWFSFEVTADRSLVANFRRTGFMLFGYVSPTGAGDIDDEGTGSWFFDNNNLIATPNPGWRFSHWDVAGHEQDPYTSTANPLTLYADRDFTVTAYFVPAYTITASAGPGGHISPSGAVTVDHGGNQAFSIVPNLGYHIADVEVDGASVGAVANYEFTNVTAAHVISASFAADSPAGYTITATAGEGGQITPGGPVSVDADGTQAFVISSHMGYIIDQVRVDGTLVVSKPGYTWTYNFENVAADHTISATFAPGYQVRVISGTGAWGNVTGEGFNPATNSGGYYAGESAVLTANPATGYSFTWWTSGGSVYSDSSAITVTASGPLAFGVRFDRHYTITASAGTGGSISPAGAATVKVTWNPPSYTLYYPSQPYAITPASGYHIADVLVDGASQGVVDTFTFPSLTPGATLVNHTVSAVFAPDSTGGSAVDQIREIISFFTASLADGTLAGAGRTPKLAENQLKSFANMLREAERLIEQGYTSEAIELLGEAYLKTDGLPKPADSVQGTAAPELAIRIQALIDYLGHLD